MELVECNSCGHKVAQDAKTCPSCGTKNPTWSKSAKKTNNFLSTLLGWILAPFVIFIVFMIFSEYAGLGTTGALIMMGVIAVVVIWFGWSNRRNKG